MDWIVQNIAVGWIAQIIGGLDSLHHSVGWIAQSISVGWKTQIICGLDSLRYSVGWIAQSIFVGWVAQKHFYGLESLLNQPSCVP